MYSNKERRKVRRRQGSNSELHSNIPWSWRANNGRILRQKNGNCDISQAEVVVTLTFLCFAFTMSLSSLLYSSSLNVEGVNITLSSKRDMEKA